MLDLNKFYQLLGYDFKDPQLIIRALTHSSYFYKNSAKNRRLDYQRLEFLGDRILGLEVAKWLFVNFPEADEKLLGLYYGTLVSAENLEYFSKIWDLSNFLQFRGLGELSLNVASDTVEAIFAALFLDGACVFLTNLITNYCQKHVGLISKDFKMQLQERSHQLGMGVPVYLLREQNGLMHAPEFVVEVKIVGQRDENLLFTATGVAKNKKDAEKQAAKNLLDFLEK